MNEQALARGISKGISGGATNIIAGATGLLLVTSLIYPDLFKDIGALPTRAINTVKDAISSSTATGSEVASVAARWENKEYKPGVSAMCASFVRTVLKDAGVNVGVSKRPWDTGLQPNNGPLMARSFFGDDIGVRVNPKDIQPGDVLGFTNTYGSWSKGAITHVGIAVSATEMIDRSTRSAPVKRRSIFNTFPNSQVLIIRPHAYRQSGSFDQALKFTLKYEGGYSNHPADKGGKTYKGIIQANLNKWKPGRSVTSLSDAEVKEIYRDKFWKGKCDRYPTPLSTACFDTWVNFAPDTAKSFLNSVDTNNPRQAAIEIAKKRMAFRHQRVREESSQTVFLQGWLNRDKALLQEVAASR